MDEFEQNDLEKQEDDSHSTIYQNAIMRKFFHEKNNRCGTFSIVLDIKLGGRMTELF